MTKIGRKCTVLRKGSHPQHKANSEARPQLHLHYSR